MFGSHLYHNIIAPCAVAEPRITFHTLDRQMRRVCRNMAGMVGADSVIIRQLNNAQLTIELCCRPHQATTNNAELRSCFDVVPLRVAPTLTALLACIQGFACCPPHWWLCCNIGRPALPGEQQPHRVVAHHMLDTLVPAQADCMRRGMPRGTSTSIRVRASREAC